MAAQRGPVVVGVDGSEQSVVAASWAVTEAELRHADVHLVLLNDRPYRDDEFWATLQHVVDRLAAQHPRSRLYPQLARGQPAAELVHRSAQAQLTVVGTRGRGPITSTLLGSVSTKLAMHAHSPIAVVREPPAEGPVVVGLDGSQHSQAALRFAFETADQHGTELIAMQVWQEADAEHPQLVAPLDIDVEAHHERVRCGLAEQLAGWTEQYPNVPVRTIAQRGHVVEELTRAAREAQLLVVGHRGRGGFTGLLLGSVAAGVLRHAPGVVAVIRDRERDKTTTSGLGIVRQQDESGAPSEEPRKSTRPAVVAGVDGSERSLEAAQWAAAEAQRRDAPLHLLIAGDRTEHAENALREATQRCREQAPGLDITHTTGLGHPVDELIHHSKHARLVVMGTRGHSGFTNVLLGSVSRAVAAYAECPVIVVRGTPAPTAPVIVGLDDSPGSQAALHFAVPFAAGRDVELVAMQVWHEEWPLAASRSAADRERVQRQIELSLADRVAACGTQSVRNRTVVQRGHPVAALTTAARDAQLLVVGRRGRGGFPGMFLGSVASGVLHHAQCTVAVVPIAQES